jgi:transcriptional regulator of heat shock response
MSISITPRQQKLLNAIINEFIETAEAVGSHSLIEKYHFKLSSATIRNEMAELVFRGYLYKKHSSAGRIPTDKGWKFFVDQVKDNLNYIDASAQEEMVSNLVKVGDEKQELIRQSLQLLSLLADNAAVALIGNDLYYSGLSNLTHIPELQEDNNLERILTILEDYSTLSEIFNKKAKEEGNDDIHILIGEEDTGKEIFKNYSVIFAEIKLKNQKGFLAVIGPNRMRYDKILASIKHIADTIKHLVNN